MDWLTVLVSLFLEIRSDNSKLEIKQVYFFENNFCDSSNNCIKVGEGYLYGFQFFDERIEQPYVEIRKIHRISHGSNSSNRYVEISKDMEEKISFGLKSSKVDKNFIRIQLLTTNRPIEDSEEYKNYKGKNRNLEAHLWVEKSNNNIIINLKLDEVKSRMTFIKEKFKLLIGERLYKFIDKANSFFSLKGLEKNVNFKLCQFPSYGKCYKNFRIFLKNSQFFGLSESQKNGEDTNKAIMHPTNFMKRINKMIKEDIEKLSGGVSEKNMFSKFFARFDRGSYKSQDVFDKTAAALRTYKSALKKCFDDLRSKMLEKEIFFYIGGKYDADYYFKELHNQARDLINEYQEDYDIFDLEDKSVVFQEISDSFCDSLKKLQKKVIDELIESNFIHEQFSKLLGKDFKTKDDIITIEKIILDYLNMLTYLEFYKKSDRSDLRSYFCKPNFDYSYKSKIVSYLKITFETTFYNNFEKIEAFNEKDEKVDFNMDNYYYMESRLNCEFYCASKILRNLSIKKIKITTSRKDLVKIIEIDEFLSN